MTSKTARYILAALAVAVILPGCNREAELSAPAVLTAVLEQTDTRTAYDDVQGKLTWTEGDQVAVHVGNSFQTATVAPSDGHLAVTETTAAYRNYYAVYPASAADAANYGNSTLKVNLSASYDISDIVSGASATRTADFSPCPMVAVNDTDDSILHFHHVGGLLRITLTGVKPATKTVTVTFDKDVTGSYAVSDPDTNHPTITTGETATNNVVTFTLTEDTSLGETLASGPIVLNVPVPCGTYNSVTVATLDATGALLASQVYDVEPLVFLRHHGKKLAFEVLTFDFVFGNLVDETVEGLSDVTVAYTGGDVSFAEMFVSYKTNDGGETKTAVPYTLEYSEDGGETWSTTAPYYWLDDSFWDLNGSTTGVDLSVTVPPQVNSAPDSHHDAMVAKTPYADHKDLSLVNVATGEEGLRTTANCYVVDRPGTYKFPLVYGNSIVGDRVNYAASRGRAGVGGALRRYEGITNYLGGFKDHLDQYIDMYYTDYDYSSLPYLTTHLRKAAGAFEAVLLWQDVPGLVEVESTVSEVGGLAFLNFYVPAETITQGNALVAVLVDTDHNGTPEIAWSWHIWVTDEDLTAVKTGSNGNSFAPVNIGWCEGRTETYASRSCQVRAVQAGSGLTRTATLTQTAWSATTGGNSPYYQWGRKDPMQASNGMPGSAAYKTYYPSSSEYAPEVVAGPVSIGTAIQHPYNFYTEAGDNNDWCSTTWHNLWSSTMDGTGTEQNDNGKVKTIYDPSPVGFRVPAQDAWSDFSDANFPWETVGGGRTFTGGLFFPAAGFCRWNSGALSGVGEFGYYWTSIPEDFSGNSLTFLSSVVSNDDALSRAHGNSLRPVVDE